MTERSPFVFGRIGLKLTTEHSTANQKKNQPIRETNLSTGTAAILNKLSLSIIFVKINSFKMATVPLKIYSERQQCRFDYQSLQLGDHAAYLKTSKFTFVL